MSLRENACSHGIVCQVVSGGSDDKKNLCHLRTTASPEGIYLHWVVAVVAPSPQETWLFSFSLINMSPSATARVIPAPPSVATETPCFRSGKGPSFVR